MPPIEPGCCVILNGHMKGFVFSCGIIMDPSGWVPGYIVLTDDGVWTPVRMGLVRRVRPVHSFN